MTASNKKMKKETKTKIAKTLKITILYGSFCILAGGMLDYAILKAIYAVQLPQNAPKCETRYIEPQTATTTLETAIAPKKQGNKTVVGIASWYDYKLDGVEWSKSHATCASRTLKRYSTARVTNIETGKSVDCYVNDYIEHPDREIDLSSYAFAKIAPLGLGLVKVKIEQL